MTTRRAGNQPTPEQIAAGGPPPQIEIIQERRITTTPVPGQTEDVIAVTYRVAPDPPRVIFVPLAELPDWVFRRDHPGQDPPDNIQERGDEALRQRIQALRRNQASRPRRI